VIAHRLVGMLLALWAGSLVTVCAIAAPSLFTVLSDRQAAGQVAARLFLIEMLIGVIVSASFLAAMAMNRIVATRSLAILVVVAAVAPLMSEVVLGPLMDSARRAGDMARFGALHGVSALLFGVACVASVIALWLFNRPAG
jgi:Domain of unknown function (DUF4149)